MNREDLAGAFIAESPKVIERALNAGYVPVSFLMEPRHVETQARDILARCGEVPVYPRRWTFSSSSPASRSRAGCSAPCAAALPTVETVCAGAKRVAVLEDVMNPTNVGAIFRSAAALGIDAVLLTQACSDPLYRRAIRVSMGTVFQVPWTYLPEIWPQTLRALRLHDGGDGAVRCFAAHLRPAAQKADCLAVVLGTEGDGLAESTIAA